MAFNTDILRRIGLEKDYRKKLNLQQRLTASKLLRAAGEFADALNPVQTQESITT